MKAFKLNNTTDVAFSASPASAGDHRALGHVPGSALWGVVAADRYRRTGGSAFEAVHSGRLRITPGFPVVDGEPAFPAPQVLRRPKHDQQGLPWNTIWSTELGAGEALKNAYVTGSGTVVRSRLSDRGKTAMREGERRAADGQYFQYEHLDRDQDWLAWIEGVEAEDSGAALVGRPLRLGRSRLPEYGGSFGCEPQAGWRDPRADQWKASARETLVLWCLSDLACVDEWGSPTLTPKVAHLGVGDFPGRLDPARSMILGRRYAPWNTYLNAPDREHVVVEAGSVLVFELQGEVRLDLFREGCGRWRERGLGLVWPNPPLLMTPDPALRDMGFAALRSPADRSEGGTLSGIEVNVVTALRDRRDARGELDTIAAEAKALKAMIWKTLEAANGRGELTPGPSQWSRLATVAERDVDLHAALFGRDGLCVGNANLDWRALEPSLRRIVGGRVNRQALARAAWRLRAEWTGGEE